MDPVGAFSLACNVLTVVDFISNVLKGGLYLAQPGKNSLPENRAAALLATDLRSLTAKIQTRPSGTADPRLIDLCAGCDELSQELIGLLDSLKVVKQRQLVSKAIKTQFEKKRISELESRLDGYGSEIHLYVTTDLRYDQSHV